MGHSLMSSVRPPHPALIRFIQGLWDWLLGIWWTIDKYQFGLHIGVLLSTIGMFTSAIVAVASLGSEPSDHVKNDMFSIINLCVSLFSLEMFGLFLLAVARGFNWAGTRGGLKDTERGFFVSLLRVGAAAVPVSICYISLSAISDVRTALAKEWKVDLSKYIQNKSVNNYSNVAVFFHDYGIYIILFIFLSVNLYLTFRGNRR